MGEATGLGLVDVALLEAVDGLTAYQKKKRVRTDRLLEAVEDVTGVASDEAYRVVQRLVQPWHSWLSPLIGDGNFGSEQGDPASASEYTEVRLSPLGVAALAAERGASPALPIGLCNGSLAHGGKRPPFSPYDVVACLRALIADPAMTDRALRTLLPRPASSNGCHLDVDTRALWAGRKTDLTQRVRSHVEDGALVFTAVPLGIGIDRVAEAGYQVAQESWRAQDEDVQHIPPEPPVVGTHCYGEHDHHHDPESGVGWFAYAVPRGRRWHGPDCRDESSDRTGTRVVVTPGGERDLEWLQTEMLRRWPLRADHEVRLPAPMAALMRHWAVRCGDGHHLDVLEQEARR